MSDSQHMKETGEGIKKTSVKKIVCPFDLDAVFSMQYSVTGLKSVLEFIIENMDATSIQLSEISETILT